MAEAGRRASATDWAKRLRLASGLVLFAFVGTHFLNHALGLVSLAAMEAGRAVFLALWRNPPATVLLYGAAATHVALVLWSLWRRRTLRGIGAVETVRTVFGLSIPPLLVTHVLANRGLNAAFGHDDTYAWVLVAIWVQDPLAGLQQSLVAVIAWVHGCIGVWHWLRLKPWYPRLQPYLYAGALLLPVLGLLGFAAGGRAVEAMLRDPAFTEALRSRITFDLSAAAAWVREARVGFLWFLVGLGVALVATRLAIAFVEHRRGLVTLTYPMGRTVAIPPGTLTVLEASRIAGIPHASVCGGRGRCSTCRVRVAEGAEFLAEPAPDEVQVLERVGAPPGVRLACQIRPTADLNVTPLLPPTAGARDARGRPGYLQGAEREIAILFADLRAFTRLSERKLPYDVVFLLNQYFRAMGRAVEDSGGRLDKFIGDGVMALFGIEHGAQAGCRNALACARAMAEALDALNAELSHDLPEPLRIGIGIHCGPAIVGEMGYGRTTHVTAIGDAVNTASRLESATKDFGAQAVISTVVGTRAGVDLSRFPTEAIAIRGRSEALAVHVIRDARELMGQGRN